MDLNLFSGYSHDIAPNLKKIASIDSSITDVSPIDSDCVCIEQIYLEFSVIGNKSIELRTKSWALLGERISKLRDKFNKEMPEGETWTDYCSKHFKEFKKKRREQAERLYHCGEALEKFYFLGIDNCLEYFNKLLKAKKKNRDGFKYVCKKYGFKFQDIQVDTEDDQDIFKNNVKKLLAAVDQLDAQAKSGVDIDLYLKFVSVGCCFSDKVIKKLINMKTQEEKDCYIIKMIANRGELSENTGISKVQSTLSLICKMNESVERYKNDIEKYPGILRKDLLDEFFDSIKLFKDKLEAGNEN